MSMYNAIFGKNPMANALLAVVGLTQSDFARFRDCYIEGEAVAVYTRLGGGNRECWCDDKADHTCYQTAIKEIQSHRLYLHDADDDFDCTYATFYFRIPEEMKAAVAGLVAKDEIAPADKWTRFFADLNAGRQTPEVERAKKAVEPILKAIAEETKP